MEPAEFKYLVKKDRIDGSPSVEDRYADLAGRMVVHDEAAHRYLVFESPAAFAARPPPDRPPALHEVIFGHRPQRLKFDIDAALPDAAGRPGVDALVDTIIEAVIDELCDSYGVLATRQDMAVTDSSGAAGAGGAGGADASANFKVSYHILCLPYAVANHEEAQEFTARVVDRLGPAAAAIVDAGVNKRTQNFRLAGSAKRGSARVKRLSAQFGTAGGLAPADLLVTAPAEMRVLPSIVGPRAPRAARAAGAQDAVLALAARLGTTDGHTFTAATGALLCFRRDRPTHCRICDEVHHNDNSLMLSSAATEGITSVFEHCRQARGRSRLVGVIGAAAAGGAPAAPDRIARRVAELKAGADPHVATAFERLPGAAYDEPAMRDYELVPTLAVAAQMKLGKTKAMRRYIDRHFPAGGAAPPVVRFVTFRQTFSRALSEAFPDFTMYSDVTGDLDAARQPRLIVQVESLHRLRMPARPEPVDLLVLDEVESILAQFSSGLHRNFTASFAMFQWMCRTARHVVVMDANLGDRTFNLLRRLRPAHPPLFHWNRFARAAGDRYWFTADQGLWLGRLYAAVRAGQRVVLPTNSLQEARAYEAALRREFPARAVALYSSETAPSEKLRHFGDVHRYWGALDVLIYTPTCTAGVSFEIEHFDALFAFFCDTSCDVETCRQMLGRVRNLRLREHHICLRAGVPPVRLPATADAVRRQLYDQRAALSRAPEVSALQFEYDDAGGIHYYESDFFHLWLDTTCAGNLSRNDFARRFIDQVADTGADVDVLAPAPDGGGAALMTAHRQTRTGLKAARSAAVAAAAVLTPEAAAEVRAALENQQDVEPADRLALERHRLCDAYAWHGRPVSEAFVAAYQSPVARRVYRNLCTLFAAGAAAGVAGALVGVRAAEAARVGGIRAVAGARDTAESRDLSGVYVSGGLSLAHELLAVCGFRDFRDDARRPAAALEAGLRAALPDLRRCAARLVAEFEIGWPPFDRLAREPERAPFLSGMLRVVNAAARLAFGVEVAARKPRRAGAPPEPEYFLRANKVGALFAFAPEADDRPGGPRPHVDG